MMGSGMGIGKALLGGGGAASGASSGIGSALLGAVTGNVGAAVPFLASAIFGNLFKSKKKRLEEEQLQLQNDAMKFNIGRQKQMDPYFMQALRGSMGRLPDHMQGSMNQFTGGGPGISFDAMRERKGFNLPQMER